MEDLLKEFQSLPFYKEGSWATEKGMQVFQHPDLLEFVGNVDSIEEIFYAQLDEFVERKWDFYSTDLFEDTFQMQNFYPALYKKDVGSGSWVKVKSPEGYHVYWAKKAPRKTLSVEALQRKYKKITSKDVGEKGLAEIERDMEFMDELSIAQKHAGFPHDLQFVKIMKTRTQIEYLLPYQYEIVSDITLYTRAITDKMNKGAVKYKSLFTGEDKDQIFYLQSRGIDKDTAIMLSKLKQVYFKIDTAKLLYQAMQRVDV